MSIYLVPMSKLGTRTRPPGLDIYRAILEELLTFPECAGVVQLAELGVDLATAQAAFAQIIKGARGTPMGDIEVRVEGKSLLLMRSVATTAPSVKFF